MIEWRKLDTAVLWAVSRYLPIPNRNNRYTIYEHRTRGFGVRSGKFTNDLETTMPYYATLEEAQTVCEALMRLDGVL